jgi:dTDP-4-amino-4,6-dideoxygalactose transaminase
MIPVSRPTIGGEELAAVGKVFESGWLGMGSWVKEFEDALSKFLDGRHAVAVNTGTSAIHLALLACGIGAGDEVIVPSLTFAATVQAIVATGATPVFCDVEPDTLNVDPADVQGKITARTRAIVPVHYRGFPCEMEKLTAMAAPVGIRIVEDAAHAFGSSYGGRKIGSFGDVSCFSFDPIKIITCGEGGAVVTGDKAAAETVRKQRILGISKDTWSRYRHERSWFYDVESAGFRCHMSNINAAIGLVQMRRFPEFLRRRIEIAGMYDQRLAGIAGITLLRHDYQAMAPFCYIIRTRRRDALMAHLKERGIDTGIHYIPNHLQTFFAPWTTRLPITEKIWEEILTLPLYPGLTDAEAALVCDSIREFNP